jgi:cell division protein FtsZ
VRVTVIAAGFDGGEPTTSASDIRRGSFVAGEETDPFGRGATATATLRREQKAEPVEERAAQPQQQSWSSPASDLSLTGAVALDPASEDEDADLDVPDFLK